MEILTLLAYTINYQIDGNAVMSSWHFLDLFTAKENRSDTRLNSVPKL